MNKNRDVWVLVEAEDGRISRHAAALLEEGKKLAEEQSGELHALYLGAELGGIAAETGALGAGKLYACIDEKLRQYDPLRYQQVLVNLLKQLQPRLLLALSSSLGSDLLPRLAFTLQSPLVTHCAEIEVEADGELLFLKPVHKGRLFAKVRCQGEGMRIASYLAERLPSCDQAGAGSPAALVPIPGPVDDAAAIKVTGFLKADHRTIDITEADVIVAVGRGVVSPESFGLVRKFADGIGGAIGGTRPMVDAGVIPYERQIGQTGKRVAPRLIFLMGISGATEFVQGIAGGAATVAVNLDPQSPVFKAADLGIVGDLEQLMPALVKHVHELTGSDTGA